MSSISADFYDLPPEERAYWYEKAEKESGQAFDDLTPEERARYYERALGEDHPDE